MISYRKLIKKLEEQNISQYRLKKDGILGSATISKIYKDKGESGESIDIKVVDKLCKLLKCQPGDILECVPDKEGYYDGNKRKLELAAKKMLRKYGSLDNIKLALEDNIKNVSACDDKIESLRSKITEGAKDEEYKFSLEYLDLLQQLHKTKNNKEFLEDKAIDLKRAINFLEENNISG